MAIARPLESGVKVLRKTAAASKILSGASRWDSSTILALALSVIAVLIALISPFDRGWTALLVSLGIVASARGVSLREPRTGTVLPVGVLPVLTAIAYGLPWPLYFLGGAALAVQHLRSGGAGRRLIALVQAPAIVGMYATYRLFTDASESGFMAAGLAGTLVYYVILSAAAVAQGSAEAKASIKRWFEGFYSRIPLCLLLPALVGVVALLVEGTTPLERAFGAFVLLGATAYLTRRPAESDAGHSDASCPAETARDDAVRSAEALTQRLNQPENERILHLLQSVGPHWQCSEQELRDLELAAVLRDVGNLAVPDSILQKPTGLTDREFEEMASHPSLSAAIVEAAHLPTEVREAVLHHHEHWDGSGYPAGLEGEGIPRLARMLTVVDCCSALLSERPYRQAMELVEATRLMTQQSGTIFDPRLLATFLRELPTIHAAWKGTAPRQSTPVADELLDEHGSSESSRQRGLEALASAPHRLAAFYEILSVLGADLNFDKGLQDCLRILRQAIPCDRTGIFIREGDKYVLLQADGFPDHCISRLSTSSMQGLMPASANERRPRIANSPPGEGPDGRVPRYLDDVRCSLIAPLIVDQRVIGMIALCSKTPDAFLVEQAQLLTLITGKVASTVLSSRTLRRIFLEAETDTLTELPNARAVFRRLETELERAERRSESLAVFFLDLDDLKPVNDSLGHGAGDRLLAGVARILRSSLRPYDFLGRVGGDEFLAIMPGIAGDQVNKRIIALKQAVAQNDIVVGPGRKIGTTVSVGAAIYPSDASEGEELVYLSDRRMYRDKKRTKSDAGSKDWASLAG